MNENNEYTDEQIRQNKVERLTLANELLQDHPHVVDTGYSDVGMEITADFKSANPDTDLLEVLLGLERWLTVLMNDDDYGLVIRVGWDVNDEYVCLTEDGEEVPFSRWADEYDWRLAEYETPIASMVEDAGWERK